MNMFGSISEFPSSTTLQDLILLFTGGVACYFLRQYFAGGVCKSKVRLDGKTALVTGASSGIGKATAKDLARRGARVILACRNVVSAKAAAAEIARETGNANIVVMNLDLSSQKSVRDFAETFQNNEEKLHILINNAGIFYVPKSITDDGIEIVFATNYLGHFLLTYLLLDKLRSSAPARIINVSSRAYEKVSDINWEDACGGSETYDRLKIYAQSKLAMVLFTRELHRRLKRSGVSAFALHPGMARTEIFRSFPPYTNRILGAIQWPIRLLCQKSPEEAAQTTIYCAVEDIEEYSGSFFSDCNREEIPEFARNPVKAKQLWTKSRQLCILTD